MSSGATPQASRQGDHGGLERARSILHDRFAEFHVSRRRLRKVERIQLVRDRREAANQQLGFASRPFVLCGLPVRCPPRSTLLYERRNGSLTLQITGHPEFGLSFGQDRLVPIFLATLAVRQQSQTIRFRSGAEMLDTFGMAKGGKKYRRLVSALALHGLTSQVPHFVDIALSSHAQRPRMNAAPIRVFWYSEPSFSASVQQVQIDHVPVRVYSTEKTITDCFKYRNKIGLDVAIEGLRLYCERTRKPNRRALLEFATINRVQRVMRPYLEALL